MISSVLITVVALLTYVHAQQIGINSAELNPPLIWEKCTGLGHCKKVNGSVTIDANWRWTHNVGGYTNCKHGNTWDSTICPDPTTCAENCALEGVNYANTGVATAGNALTLTLSTVTNSGPRIYLLSEDESQYEIFKLNQQEFAFDVDMHEIGCGINAALYFSEMDAHGGKAPTNVAGAKYGLGYCDAQCPNGDNWFNGQANFNITGICCNEMDIWEANKISTAFTTHGCLQDGAYTCPTGGCSGQCDPSGCDFNAYRQGQHNFYGPGKLVNTNKKMTVVTQFLTDNGRPSGHLVEIRRLYVQNGRVILNAPSFVKGIPPYNSISTQYCDIQKKTFGDTNTFEQVGGLKPLSKAFQTGMVLVFSLWDDPYGGMTWLDGYSNSTTPGISRGTCTAGLDTSLPLVNVTFSNIKFGSIGSTFQWV